MTTYSRNHLSHHALLQVFATHLSQNRGTTASQLADIAEIDHRRLHLPAAHASMYSYCVHEFHMSEDTAYKRIRAARAARKFPAIFPAVAEGRLNLSGVLLLASHLQLDNVDELIAAAAHKTNSQIERLIAERFPRPDVPTLVQAIGPVATSDQLAVRPVVPSHQLNTAGLMEPLPPAQETRAKLAPLSPGRFAVQFTVDAEESELLAYAQSLLGHALPSGDVGRIFIRALGELVGRLEKRKFAKAVRTRPRQGEPKGRYVPAETRRTVWRRDGGQCTFVSESGRRCEARTRLEFDHVQAVARGGKSTVDGLRLCCLAHNQYAAECTFGTEFMREKRQGARRKATRAKVKAYAVAKARAQAESETASEAAGSSDVTPWLRQLGYTAQEARRGAELCAHLPDASLQERVRVALRGLAPANVRRSAPPPPLST